MTFKEKWELEHPDEKFSLTDHGTESWRCPYKCGYEKIDADSAHCEMGCTACWNREMPDTEEKPRILDSGKRQQFETGAVRDIQHGKGRCDLMPLEVLCKYFKKPIFGLLGMFLKDGNTAHLYECIRLFSSYYGEETNTATDCTMFLEVAKHFEEGAKKYGENNWQKGLPVHCYIDSAVRHYLKWLRGDKDEPHDRAFVWNLLCCIWEVDFSPRAKGETAVADTITIYADNTPIEHIHSDLVRYGDCPAGLFETDEGVFVKTEIADADKYGAYIAIHINTGHTRLFDNDILVRPIDSPFTDERCGDE